MRRGRRRLWHRGSIWRRILGNGGLRYICSGRRCRGIVPPWNRCCLSSSFLLSLSFFPFFLLPRLPLPILRFLFLLGSFIALLLGSFFFLPTFPFGFQLSLALFSLPFPPFLFLLQPLSFLLLAFRLLLQSCFLLFLA